MPDSKISGLAAQTTIADDDMFVLETAATATKKITGANLKAGITTYRAGGTDVAVADGGTGSSTAANARTALGLAIGTDVAAATGIPIASLADPTTGKVIGSTSNAAAAVFPPGYLFNRVAITTDATSTATVEGSATTIITSGSVTYDGTTVIRIKVVAYNFGATTANLATIVNIWEDSTDLGRVARVDGGGAASSASSPLYGEVYRTPSAGAHVYTARLWGGVGTKTVYATAPAVPAYIEITKVS